MTSKPGQGEEHWKQKYYDQLDQLEQKEKEWNDLESLLKKAIGRLSLAAEGHHDAIDRHIKDIRATVKSSINKHRLEIILDDLSKLLAKIEESQSAPDKQIISSLQQLIESLEFPKKCNKAKTKLIKHFENALDDEKESIIKETVVLLKLAITSEQKEVDKKPGLFERLIGSSTDGDKEIDFQAMSSIIVHIIKLLPWPEEVRNDVQDLMDATVKSQTDKQISSNISQLELLVNKWKNIKDEVTSNVAEKNTTFTSPVEILVKINQKIKWPEGKPGEIKKIEAELQSSPDKADILLTEYALLIDALLVQQQNRETSLNDDLEAYRSCVISFLNQLDNKESPDGKIAALRLSVKDASQRSDLDKLSAELAGMLGHEKGEGKNDYIDLTDSRSLPSIQELLIRLLEQLVVPTDLHKEVEDMKARLEKDTDPDDWKKLLKDVALLINSIRSRMQKEKHEFESFLQQITTRLKEMDSFLQNESEVVELAEQEGKIFDIKVKAHVKDIRNDLTQAEDLEGLKHTVESRLENISQHIKNYRDVENKRYSNAQKNVFEMQDKMMSLEKETDNLKQVIVQKNKLALFDALTEIPNRLAYDQKAEEEMARWKRFGNPLSLAIWDVDLFKKVNDTYGHKAGDKVLKTIAQLLNDRIRETDFLARFGGEEFVMLLPGTIEEETLRLVNDLREKVAACGFHYHGDLVKITVSCGVSSFREGDSLEQVFERADQALYKAKENGRNQCVIASCRSD
jgi:diguanylate cyclase